MGPPMHFPGDPGRRVPDGWDAGGPAAAKLPPPTFRRRTWPPAGSEEVAMSTTAEAIEVRPFQVDISDDAVADLRRRIAATRWPTKELVDDRSQGVQLATMQELARLLGERVRLRASGGAAERAAAVHDRDRRGRHPLHPREVGARERVAADHDPRLARLGHRAARDHRAADRPDRARRTRRGRVPPRAAVHPRLRLLRRADRARLGPCRTGTRLGTS